MNLGGYTEIMSKNERKTKNKEFNKKFDDYQIGFGSVTENSYWLGLTKMSELTSNKNNPMNLRIEISSNNQTHSIIYSNFSVGNYEEGFILKLGKKLSGDLEDWSSQHTNMKFSAYDKYFGNDDKTACAKMFKAAWWFTGCYKFCLTCEFDEYLGNYFHYDRDGTFNRSVNYHAIKMMILPQKALNQIEQGYYLDFFTVTET
jgi:hypothetical protein